jgi:hypothetical protein
LWYKTWIGSPKFVPFVIWNEISGGNNYLWLQNVRNELYTFQRQCVSGRVDGIINIRTYCILSPVTSNLCSSMHFPLAHQSFLRGISSNVRASRPNWPRPALLGYRIEHTVRQNELRCHP